MHDVRPEPACPSGQRPARTRVPEVEAPLQASMSHLAREHLDVMAGPAQRVGEDTDMGLDAAAPGTGRQVVDEEDPQRTYQGPRRWMSIGAVRTSSRTSSHSDQFWM